MTDELTPPPQPARRLKGWAIPLFFLVFAAGAGICFPGLLALMPKLLPGVPLPTSPAPQTPLSNGLGEIAILLPLLAATVLMARLEHRPLDDYGLGTTKIGTLTTTGAFWGFAMISLLIGAMVALGAYSLQSPSADTGTLMKGGISWAITMALVGLTEELLFRGYLLASLARTLGFGWAALIMSAFFAMAHFSNNGEAALGIAAAGTAGLVLCYSIWKTGSLWWAIAWHAAWNWGESFFYGTPDSGRVASAHFFTAMPIAGSKLSGGTVGPEGSWLVFGALAITALVIHLFVRNPRPVPVIYPTN